MKLFIKNIGKIEYASVEIDGITVIAGENDMGKSTVGRTLFSIFNSFYNIDEQIQKEKVQSIENAFEIKTICNRKKVKCNRRNSCQ